MLHLNAEDSLLEAAAQLMSDYPDHMFAGHQYCDGWELFPWEILSSEIAPGRGNPYRRLRSTLDFMSVAGLYRGNNKPHNLGMESGGGLKGRWLRNQVAELMRYEIALANF